MEEVAAAAAVVVVGEVGDVLADAEAVAMVAAVQRVVVVVAAVVEVVADAEAAAVESAAAVAVVVVALVVAAGLESDFEVFLKPVEGKKKAFLGSSGRKHKISGKWRGTKT